MKWRVAWVLGGTLLALTACRKSTEPASEVAASSEVIASPESAAKPGGAASTPSKDAVRYVVASTLKLRGAPQAGARVLGRLAINSPLIAGSSSGNFTAVEVANGKQGWVASAYLEAEPVTKAAALERAKSPDPALRLSWLQRAAAVAPFDLGVLEALEAAYEAAGKKSGAVSVARLRARLAVGLRPIRHADRPALHVEWEILSTGGARPPREIPKEKWQAYGVPPDARFWILTERGPAVPARVEAVNGRLLNECGGVYGILLRLDPETPLPEGALPILTAFGPEAPAGWIEDWTPPSVPADAAVRAESLVAAAAKDAQAGPLRASVVTDGQGGALVRVIGDLPSKETEIFQPVLAWDLQVPAQGAARLLRPAQRYNGFFDTWLAARDVDGDGRVDVLADDRCSTTVYDPEGERLARTFERCCGC